MERNNIPGVSPTCDQAMMANQAVNETNIEPSLAKDPIVYQPLSVDLTTPSSNLSRIAK